MDEIKLYLIQKYVNKNISPNVFIEDHLGANKIEYSLIDLLLMLSLEKVMVFYEPLLIFGCDKETEKKINMFLKIIENFKKTDMYKNKDSAVTKGLIKQFEFDIKEIDELVLKKVSDTIKVG